jgi:hypothetical protein
MDSSAEPGRFNQCVDLGYGLQDRGSILVRVEFFSTQQCAHRLRCPFSHVSNGYPGSLLGIKLPDREAN